MKVLLTFSKGEGVRWLGHLDLMRAFERAIRRSGVGAAHSEGFNPRIRLAFASALGLGVTGGEEPALLELSGEAPAEDVYRRLEDKLPQGIRLLSVRAVAPDEAKTLLQTFRLADLELRLTEGAYSVQQVNLACAGLLGRASVEVVRMKERARKTVDIRPFIRTLAAHSEDTGVVVLATTLIGGDGGVRPAEITTALAETVPGLELRRAHRIRLRPLVPDSEATDLLSAGKEVNQ